MSWSTYDDPRLRLPVPPMDGLSGKMALRLYHPVARHAMKSPSWKMAMNSPPTAPFEPSKKEAISGAKDRKRLPLRHPKSQVGGRRTELQDDGRDYHGILRYILPARGCRWGTGGSREELRCEVHSNIPFHPLLTTSCSKLRPTLNR